MDWKDFQNEPTEELIAYMQHRTDTERAEAAFAALTFRFNKEITDICRKIAKKWNYDYDVADLIAEKAFERIWKYPNGFKPEKCNQLTIDRCLFFYLLRTAQHCFFDHHNKETGKNLSPYDGSEEVVVRFPELENLPLPNDRLESFRDLYQKMEKALARLSPKHKTIYLTYKAYEKEGFKLPRPLLKQLREELELTQNSIRVYKNEAFHCIDQLLKQQK